jgi:hypothetical protein
MRTGLKLGAVALALVAQLGCMEVETKLTLAADGSGTLSVYTLLQQKFLDIMAEGGKQDDVEQNLLSTLPHAMSDARKAELAALGLGMNNLGVERSEAGLAWNLAVSFRDPAALAADLTGEGKPKATPSLTIYDLGGGKYEMHVKNDPLDTKGLLDAPVPPPESTSKKSAKAAKKSAAKSMESLKDLLSTAADFKVATEITVPGTVESASPAMGMSFSGGTVVWALNGASMMGDLGATDPSAAPMQEDRVVVFQMAAGQSLPASVLTARPEAAPTEATPAAPAPGAGG